jgi:6-phosphogluconolactonase
MNLIRLVNFGSSLFLSGAVSVLCVATAFASDAQPLVFVGTYTTHGSKGIYAYRFDATNGKLNSLGLAAETPQPSFVVASRDGKFLYAANEMQDFDAQKSGAVSAFAIAADGKLKLLNQLASRGADPAHITLDHTGKYLIAANYTGGNLTVFPIEQNGALGQATDFVQHKGSSVNRERQEGPHPHEVVMSPDNRFVLVPDLGLDEVVIYAFDAAKGKLGTSHSVKVTPGSGPRHLAFSKDERFVYLMTEMKSEIVVYSYEKSSGGLKELQTISSLPADFKGENTGAEIEVHPSGRFLYASNRGDNNSIAVFAIDTKSGKLKLEQIESTQGKTPRHFAIDPSGKWLLAENQDSDNIVIFKIDEKSGHLTASGQQVHISSPTCIEFVPGR